jgi:hypothetical protein
MARTFCGCFPKRGGVTSELNDLARRLDKKLFVVELHARMEPVPLSGDSVLTPDGPARDELTS